MWLKSSFEGGQKLTSSNADVTLSFELSVCKASVIFKIKVLFPCFASFPPKLNPGMAGYVAMLYLHVELPRRKKADLCVSNSKCKAVLAVREL